MAPTTGGLPRVLAPRRHEGLPFHLIQCRDHGSRTAQHIYGSGPPHEPHRTILSERGFRWGTGRPGPRTVIPAVISGGEPVSGLP